MNRIEQYQFGKLIINGKEYTQDLIITPTKIINNWRRNKSHLLTLNDLKDVIDEIESYRYFICGCGNYNRMKIADEVFDKLRTLDILYLHGKTQDIIKVFNDAIERGKSFVAAFHLTC